MYNSEGDLIHQKSQDSKTILIIGHWREIQSDTPKIQNIKEKTFELFRRDSRNVEIITYDELFERANHIINSHHI